MKVGDRKRYFFRSYMRTDCLVALVGAGFTKKPAESSAGFFRLRVVSSNPLKC